MPNLYLVQESIAMVKLFSFKCHSYNSTVILFVVILFLQAFTNVVIAAEYPIYGPRVFLRGTAAPIIETDTIVSKGSGSFLLKIYNAENNRGAIHAAPLPALFI